VLFLSTKRKTLVGPEGLSESLENQPTKNLSGMLKNNQRRRYMNNIVSQIDDVIVKELTTDLSSGAFYTEVDEETLEMALVAMWENFDEWERRGIILGRG